MAIPSLLPNEELSYTLKIKEGDEFVYQLNILNESLITEYRNKTVDEVVGMNATKGYYKTLRILEITSVSKDINGTTYVAWVLNISSWVAWHEKRDTQAETYTFLTGMLKNPSQYTSPRSGNFLWSGVPTPATSYLSSLNWEKGEEKVELQNTTLSKTTLHPTTNRSLIYTYTFDQKDGYLRDFCVKANDTHKILYAYSRT